MPSHAKLMDKFSIVTSTVGDKKKNKAEIQSFGLVMEDEAMSKKGSKVMHVASHNKLDIAVGY